LKKWRLPPQTEGAKQGAQDGENLAGVLPQAPEGFNDQKKYRLRAVFLELAKGNGGSPFSKSSGSPTRPSPAMKPP
jgi:hypothetical protein